jgi:ribonuclease T2
MRPFRSMTVASAVLTVLLSASSASAFDRNRPGIFDYYVLVLGWSPTYCIIEGRLRRDTQCDAETPHDFVLHGLWPQYDRGWPKDCFVGRRPWVPSEVIDSMRDIMPSKNLIIHEYATHGTCAGLTPEQYYAAARTLYDRVSLPPKFTDPEAWRHLSPESVEREFLAANPWLSADMIAVTCRREALLDIRVCFDRDLRPRECGINEDQRRLCRAGTINVPVP